MLFLYYDSIFFFQIPIWQYYSNAVIWHDDKTELTYALLGIYTVAICFHKADILTMASRYKLAVEALRDIMDNEIDDEASEPEDQATSDEDKYDDNDVAETGGSDDSAYSYDEDENVSGTESDSGSSSDASSTRTQHKRGPEVGSQSAPFISTNSLERWSSSAPIARQAITQNVLKGKPGPTSYAKQRMSAENPVIDCFLLFFSLLMLDHVLVCTTSEGTRVKQDDWT